MMLESTLFCIFTVIYTPLHVQGDHSLNFMASTPCPRKLVPVNSKLNASEACLEFCPNHTVKEVNDESLCAYDVTTPGRLSSTWVLRSGHCVNGTCLEPGEVTRQNAVNLSCLAPPREVFEQELLVSNCTYKCYKAGETRTATDGTPCVLKRKWIADLLTGYKAPTEAGICHNGSCVQGFSDE
ncbi:uncharacterized protein LOC144120135 [Amblyomma americanum]